MDSLENIDCQCARRLLAQNYWFVAYSVLLLAHTFYLYDRLDHGQALRVMAHQVHTLLYDPIL